MPIATTWLILCIVGAFINTLVNIGYKIIGSRGDPVFLSACVLATSACTLFIYAAFSKGMDLNSFKGSTFPIVLATGIGGALSVVIFMIALKIGPLSLVNTTWLIAMVVFVTILGVVFMGEKLSAQTIIGLILGIAGIFLITKN